jgi:predicted AAA+ superfamily ATPase
MDFRTRAMYSYRRVKKELTYWRTQTGIEVDFIIGDDTGIEVKSALKEENILRQFFLVSFDELDCETPDGIRLLFWKSFLVKLWNGEILS